MSKELLRLDLEINIVLTSVMLGLSPVWLGQVEPFFLQWFVFIAAHTLVAFVLSFYGYLDSLRGRRPTYLWVTTGMTANVIVLGGLLLVRVVRTRPEFGLPGLLPPGAEEPVIILLFAALYGLIMYASYRATRAL